ncbi:flagellar motor protein MotA [Hyphomicrobium sp.]|uniref:flagellar motor protein MotA n=1 Tax=Hyphomicrobium sp. TaxID=82 RepID=UPI002D799DA6|nr:flagellar motor protein MotA [Hyphomicrobium sp.]HET6390077.1 flagellar motor protein MotA [Hyphomicrobium sp.]
MAKIRPGDASALAPVSRRLTPPGVFLLRMTIFLTLVGFLAAILFDQLKNSFLNNPGLNGLIVGALALGIVYAYRQVFRLYPEIRWVNAFRISDPGLSISARPVLLAPMATMLRDRTGTLSLSTAAMRSFMDSIGSRLDEARDTGRYLVGLLVFLGLLGTFWGLLETILSVGHAIDTLDSKATDNVQLFSDLKAGLAAPLKGMGTAFSSSLLGLSGSLVLGFLELQASHAHNRFYNELEEWLSGITELTPAGTGANTNDYVNRQLLSAVVEMQRSLEDFANRVADQAGLPAKSAPAQDDVRDLARGVNQLVTQMRSEQKVVREWVDEQAQSQAEVAHMLRNLADAMKRGV